MTMLLVLFVLFILLDVAALRWGYDSRDSIDSAEWERRMSGDLFRTKKTM